MSDTSGAGGSTGKELQFDHAEHAASGPAATCKVCGQPLQNTYYEVNGQPVCQGCRDQVQKAMSGGSAIGRFARAALYGSLAGLVGAAIYYGVREAVHVEFGLISVVVGLMIGKAVKKGSDGRGGWFYQLLAMFLTYSAIVLTDIPPVIQAIRDRANEQVVAADAQQPAESEPAATDTIVAEAPAAAEPPGEAGVEAPPSALDLLFAVVFLLGFAFALPVLINIESPMGLIIVAIALYEAWVINRRVPLIINGPYQIGRGDSGGAAYVEPAS